LRPAGDWLEVHVSSGLHSGKFYAQPHGGAVVDVFWRNSLSIAAIDTIRFWLNLCVSPSLTRSVKIALGAQTLHYSLNPTSGHCSAQDGSL